jgi:hypothetical protein
MPQWETYEEVATYLLDQFAQVFGLERVEGKQNIDGLRSGTSWEIDAKGYCQNHTGFIIIECRRFTTSRQSQERVGALAYRIIDTGAKGVIIVSPLGLQEGGQKIAAAENIVSVRLDERSTRHDYIMQFLNCVMFGDSVRLEDSLELTLRDKDGNIIQTVKA